MNDEELPKRHPQFHNYTLAKKEQFYIQMYKRSLFQHLNPISGRKKSTIWNLNLWMKLLNG